jgi:hypothetical protein
MVRKTLTPQKIADRERAPVQVGDVTRTIVLLSNQNYDCKPMDFALEDFWILQSGHDRYDYDNIPI